MASQMHHDRAPGLERSCAAAGAAWIRVAPSVPGVERIEARFACDGFDPHRHDTYAIGITTMGVQCFRYRGAAQLSLAGHAYVLHPDERHDGRAGTSDGFGFRTLYVEPALIREALGEPSRPLPFMRAVVSRDAGLLAAIGPALEDLDRPLEELRRDQIVLAVAEALAAGDSSQPGQRKLTARHLQAVARARDLLEANLQAGVTSAALESATGLGRYALARHFRACLGTSPYRYLVMRRLDRVRKLIRSGSSLADAALAGGFADQAHMTRHFKRTYGLTPGRWAALSASD